MGPRSWLIFSGFLACGKPTGTLEITTGPETDVFTRDPKPTRVVVEAFATDGTATKLGDAPLSAPIQLDLVEQKKTNIVTLRVTARDDSDNIIAAGSSLLVELGALADHTLQIFVQRRGELARMPQTLNDAREDPMLSILAGRFLLVVGGTDANLSAKTALYDLMSLDRLTYPPTMPFVPLSIAPLYTGELLISAQNTAQIYDFSTSTASAVAAPDGGSFADVAGGPTFEGESGAQYIVGAARSTMLSDKVLRVTSDGHLAFVRLAQMRKGAAVTWAPGRGLVVIGGGGGVEQIAPGTTASTAVSAFASDMRTGVAAPLDGNRIVVLGSGVPALYDLGCAQNCAPVAFGADPGVPIIEAYALDAESILAVGRAANGDTHVFRISGPAGNGAAREIALKIPRKNARGLRLPTGAVAIAGGSNVIESFVP